MRRHRRGRPEVLARAVTGASLLAVLALLFAADASAKTVWLCKPGQRPDPCTPGLSTTVYSPTLKKLRVEHITAVKHPPIDCFYAYPTVSRQKTLISNLQVQSVERSVALLQVGRYSQYCRMYAPMYRQVTHAGQLMHPTQADFEPGISDVRAAFQTYLTRYNHGRGFVIIGHSQGSRVLKSVIAREVDPKPSVRNRLLSAILLGGNVLVKRGSGVGGDFKHIPACRSRSQLHCVVAYSTFDKPVPANSKFGRTTVPGDVVLCTNPAALSGGSAPVDAILPGAPPGSGSQASTVETLLGLAIPKPMPTTYWWSQPTGFQAQCSSAGGANVLQITAVHGAKAPTLPGSLHDLDANIALGDLLALVKAETAAFAKHNHGARHAR